MNLEIIHVDTCLPCYWSGHHKAHICIPVWHGMTFDQLKASLHSEISQAAIRGYDKISEILGLMGNFSDAETRAAYWAAHDAVDNIAVHDGINPDNPDNLFCDLEQTDDPDDMTFAYFLIVESER